jgi:hypothetical protein
MKIITVGDLQNQSNTVGPHSILYCCECGGEYSANAGDYWNAIPETVMTCCDEPMCLVTKRTVYEPVK